MASRLGPWASRASACCTAACRSSSRAGETKPWRCSCCWRASSLRASAAWACAWLRWAWVTASSSRRRPVSVLRAWAWLAARRAWASASAACSASASRVNRGAPAATAWPACTGSAASVPASGAAMRT